MTRGIRLVFARRLRFTAVPSPRAGGNPSTSKYATWLSVGKASGNTAVAPPSTLMVGSKCKYQNVLSFFFLSLSFCSLLDEVLCVGGSSSSSSSLPHHHHCPHSSSSPGWTTFSTRLATSWIAVDTFYLLSSIFQIDWLRLLLLLLLSEQENNSKILCKYFVCIFHLIFNLLSFFMVFLLSSLPRICMTFCFCVYFRLMKNLWLCGRVFFFCFFCWGCVGVALSTAAILMNSIDWTRTPTKFIFSVVPLLSYTKSKVNQSFLD